MAHPQNRLTHHLFQSARAAFFGPQIFAFLPALILVGFWFGGETALIFCAVAMPIVVALVGLITPAPTTNGDGEPKDSVTKLPLRNALMHRLDAGFEQETVTGKRCAVMAIEVDDFENYLRDHGAAAGDRILQHTARRIETTLRETDLLVRLDGPRFAIALAPSHRADLETTIQIAARLQSAVAEPLAVDGLRLFLTSSIGFCLPRRASEKNSAFSLDAAETALCDAQSVGRSAIRAYSAQPRRKRVVQSGLARDVEFALENGHILPWFQPQLSTDTGKVSGVEALARWIHPDHGVIAPGAFLPAISAAGLSTRLSEIVLFQTLKSMQDWDIAGLHVPTAGVNFASEDLSDPKLCDKIQWELDRFDLSPDRLTIEILETVIARSSDDVITSNIAKLSEMGCGIDLDDFGTGHASIANIRRFFVKRIKIDRSFVSQVDTDRQQQQMLCAILEMSNRLGIDALAEGVETSGEHALLSQLGCAHVQGFHIAKPMPIDEITTWLEKHQNTMLRYPEITRKKGT